MKKPSIEIMFRFYEIVFYFLVNCILVIEIVIVCFIFFDKDQRDGCQQCGAD